MSFVSSLCLSYTGSTPLGGVMNIYSNLDLVNPVVSSVSLSDITFPNCPYDVTVPDSTTSIRILDISTRCYVDIPVQSNDLCAECNLNFTSYSGSSVGTISAGILTGSCQSNITDYYVNWYGPDNLVDIAFTSGSGSTFSYQYTHPFSGTSSIPVLQGTYTPVIQEVIISGITFSITGGTSGSGEILANLDCLNSIYVDCYRCNNQTNTNPTYPYVNYNHRVQYLVNSNLTPQSVSLTFEISASTKYIPFSFKGEVAPDRFKMSFSGQNYGGTIIGLEDYVVGNAVTSNNFNLTTFPKTAQTQYYFNKITTLTGMTVSDGDKIVIEIIPSTQNTSWDLYFGCLSSYNCTDCLTDDSYYKILSSTIVPSLYCNTVTVPFLVTGCSISDFLDTDYFSYYTNPQPGTNAPFGFPSNASGTVPYFNNVAPDFYSSGKIYPNNYFTALNWGTNNCVLSTYFNGSSSCDVRPVPTYYDRSFAPNGCGVLGYTGDSYFIEYVYNSYKNFVNNPIGGYLYDPNPANAKYYAYFAMNFPTSGNPDYCADPTPYTTYIIHPSSPIETGTTGGNYYARITANTITNGTSYTSCDINCTAYTESIINSVNSAATGGTIFSKSFSSGFYFLDQIRYYNGMSFETTYYTASTRSGYYRTYETTYNTYPYSGGSPTLIPSLSATCCYSYTKGSSQSFYNTIYHNIFKYYYTIALTNPSNVSDFDISASTISNGVPVNYPDLLIYRYSGGTVLYSDPTYII